MMASRWCLVLGLIGLVGCTKTTLETGYEPRKLGSTQAERRGFYAPAFSPEAAEARMDREAELEMRRPRPGY
jgi:hypothetical protein